jgi:hypothetical protein
VAPPVPLQRTIKVGEPPHTAQQRFFDHFTKWLGQGGFLVVEQSPGSLTYSRSRFYPWQIIVSVLLFPIGLLSLLAEKREERVSAMFVPSGDQATTITVSGGVHKGADQLTARLNEFDPAFG